MLNQEQRAYYDKLVRQGADPVWATKKAEKYTSSTQNKKWLFYLGLLMAIIGGVAAAYYSMVAIFTVFDVDNTFGLQGGLSWHLTGIIIASYIVLGVGVYVGKKGRGNNA